MSKIYWIFSESRVEVLWAADQLVMRRKSGFAMLLLTFWVSERGICCLIWPSRRTSALVTMPRAFIDVTDGWISLCLRCLMAVLFASNFVAFSSVSNHSADRLKSAASSSVQIPYPAVWRLMRLCCDPVHNIFAHLVVCDSRSQCFGLCASIARAWAMGLTADNKFAISLTMNVNPKTCFLFFLWRCPHLGKVNPRTTIITQRST